jgi:uncharacterized protein (TIGR03067 family)
MTRNRWLVGGVVALALSALPVAGVLAQAAKRGPARPAGEKGDDPKPLKGTWVVKAQTFDGDEIPAALAGQCSFAFADGSVTLKGGLAKVGDKYAVVPGEHTFKVTLGDGDAGKTIDLAAGGDRVIRGLYKVEKGKLTMVLNFAAGDRPTKFEAPAGANGVGLFACEKKDD